MSDLTAVGVHNLMGAFSVAVEDEFAVLAHLERSRYGVATFSRNRPGVPVFVDPGAGWPTAPRGPVDLVHSQPPCAPWSRGSHGAARRREEHQTAGWVRDVVGVGRRLRARVVAVESVPAAIGSPIWLDAWDQHRDVWPASAWVLVNARHHGVAQDRERVFFLLTAEGFVPEPPPKTGIISVEKALSDVPSSAPNQDDATPAHYFRCPDSDPDDHARRTAELLALLPLLRPGERLNRLVRRLGDEAVQRVAPTLNPFFRGGKLFVTNLPYRLRADGLAPVVMSDYAKFVHPQHDRFLTVREVARLCGLPDDFVVVGSIARQLQQLGRSVLPPVGRWLAGEVAAHLRGQRTRRAPGGPAPALFDFTTEQAGFGW